MVAVGTEPVEYVRRAFCTDEHVFLANPATWVGRGSIRNDGLASPRLSPEPDIQQRMRPRCRPR